VRSRLLMRDTRCDRASCRRVAQAQVERAGEVIGRFDQCMEEAALAD